MLDDDQAGRPAAAAPPAEASEPEPVPAAAASNEATATALYDYEAGEDNELSFPENAVISNVVGPDSEHFCTVNALTNGLVDIP